MIWCDSIDIEARLRNWSCLFLLYVALLRHEVIYMRMADYVRTWDNENRVWVYEHRVVIENYLGRKLSMNEHVHHIDGNPKNNSIDNLEVVTPEEHAKIHKPALKNRLCSIELCDKKHHSKGYCKTHYAQMFRKSQGW